MGQAFYMTRRVESEKAAKSLAWIIANRFVDCTPAEQRTLRCLARYLARKHAK